MKVFRFMSKKEFEKFQKGKILKNETIQKGKTSSVGFCFLDRDEYKPEEALHFLGGNVDIDICCVFETEDNLQKSYGIYRDYKKDNQRLAELEKKNFLEFLIYSFDIRTVPEMKVKEYCTTSYSNKTFKLVQYAKPYYNDNNWEWKNG